MTKIAVAHEMEELQHAVEAADLLLDVYRWKNFPTDDQYGRAPAAIGAVLSLVQLRIIQLARVLRDDEDPSTIATEHNEAGSGDRGVVLESWSPKRREQKAREALRQVQREIKVARER
ncbi:MAG: hypothetical protein FWD69_10370 [Polyangiaceae bacterium]|nr:hypothetical protein [Polyangiaceae bacterium]